LVFGTIHKDGLGLIDVIWGENRNTKLNFKISDAFWFFLNWFLKKPGWITLESEMGIWNGGNIQEFSERKREHI
jgi:hypothetical protein